MGSCSVLHSQLLEECVEDRFPELNKALTGESTSLPSLKHVGFPREGVAISTAGQVEEPHECVPKWGGARGLLGTV